MPVSDWSRYHSLHSRSKMPSIGILFIPVKEKRRSTFPRLNGSTTNVENGYGQGKILQIWSLILLSHGQYRAENRAKRCKGYLKVELWKYVKYSLKGLNEVSQHDLSSLCSQLKISASKSFAHYIHSCEKGTTTIRIYKSIITKAENCRRRKKNSGHFTERKCGNSFLQTCEIVHGKLLFCRKWNNFFPYPFLSSGSGRTAVESVISHD